ncbi:MAG: protein TolQ [Nitrospirae bacterium]|nr:MAG: protein TolQ [Nitrospirota bacterium]
MVALVLHAGPVVQAVLLCLALFSLVSWAIIGLKWWVVRRARRGSAAFLEIFWRTERLGQIFEAAKGLEGAPLAALFCAGYGELVRLSRRGRHPEAEAVEDPGEMTTDLGGVENIGRALTRATNEEIGRLRRYLTFLATTGSTAPFVGLFGTVWGIMDAFREIGARGNATLAVVAPGISEALVATAAGLAAAIPAVVAFNYFNSKIDSLTAEMDNFHAELLNIVRRHFVHEPVHEE